jgi:hypothetical protein
VGNWKSADEVFFGRNISFPSSPTPDTQKRRSKLTQYIAERAKHYPDRFLIAGWVDGGMLKLNVDQKPAGTNRGFSLLLLPLSVKQIGQTRRVVGNWATQFCRDFNPQDETTYAWENPREGRDQFLPRNGSAANGVLALRLIPPQNLEAISRTNANVQLTFTLDPQKKLVSGRPGIAPGFYKGSLVIEALESSANGSLRRTKVYDKPITLNAGTPKNVQAVFELQPGYLSQESSLRFEVTLNNKEYHPQLDSRENFWPIALKNLDARIEQK